MQRRSSLSLSSNREAFTLAELITILLILAVLAAILFPIFARTHENPKRRSCQSNLKQIGLAFMEYLQDNDECFPPAVAYYRAPDGVVYPQDWAVAYTPTTNPSLVVPATIGSYVEGNRPLFQCSSVKEAKKATYRYNDLAAGVNQRDFAGVAQSVFVAEGEDVASNVGHAYLPNEEPRPATGFDESGTCAPGKGATVKTAPLRHNDGANYCFADGHVKWWKPESVFFPDTNSISRSHKNEQGTPIGPDPAGKMDWQGKKYGATFHIK